MPRPLTGRGRRDRLPARLQPSRTSRRETTARPPPTRHNDSFAHGENLRFSLDNDFGAWDCSARGAWRSLFRHHDQREDAALPADASTDPHWYPGRSTAISPDSDYGDDQEDTWALPYVNASNGTTNQGHPDGYIAAKGTTLLDILEGGDFEDDQEDTFLDTFLYRGQDRREDTTPPTGGTRTDPLSPRAAGPGDAETSEVLPSVNGNNDMVGGGLCAPVLCAATMRDAAHSALRADSSADWGNVSPAPRKRASSRITNASRRRRDGPVLPSTSATAPQQVFQPSVAAREMWITPSRAEGTSSDSGNLPDSGQDADSVLLNEDEEDKISHPIEASESAPSSSRGRVASPLREFASGSAPVPSLNKAEISNCNNQGATVPPATEGAQWPRSRTAEPPHPPDLGHLPLREIACTRSGPHRPSGRGATIPPGPPSSTTRATPGALSGAPEGAMERCASPAPPRTAPDSPPRTALSFEESRHSSDPPDPNDNASRQPCKAEIRSGPDGVGHLVIHRSHQSGGCSTAAATAATAPAAIAAARGSGGGGPGPVSCSVTCPATRQSRVQSLPPSQRTARTANQRSRGQQDKDKTTNYQEIKSSGVDRLYHPETLTSVISHAINTGQHSQHRIIPWTTERNSIPRINKAGRRPRCTIRAVPRLQRFSPGAGATAQLEPGRLTESGLSLTADRDRGRATKEAAEPQDPAPTHRDKGRHKCSYTPDNVIDTLPTSIMGCEGFTPRRFSKLLITTSRTERGQRNRLLMTKETTKPRDPCPAHISDQSEDEGNLGHPIDGVRRRRRYRRPHGKHPSTGWPLRQRASATEVDDPHCTPCSHVTLAPLVWGNVPDAALRAALPLDSGNVPGTALYREPADCLDGAQIKGRAHLQDHHLLHVHPSQDRGQFACCAPRQEDLRADGLDGAQSEGHDHHLLQVHPGQDGGQVACCAPRQEDLRADCLDGAPRPRRRTGCWLRPSPRGSPRLLP